MPDGTRRRVLEVETATEVRIHEDQRLIAVHALLNGRGQRSLMPGRQATPKRASSGASSGASSDATVVHAPGHNVARRARDIYEAVAKRLGAAVRVVAPAGAFGVLAREGAVNGTRFPAWVE